MQRLQFELPDEKLRELDLLREVTTNKELMSSALALFWWAVREVKRGRTIASVDEANGKFKEVWMPGLENAAKHAPTPTATEALK